MNMTVDQIRTALDHMEANYSLAMDNSEYGLANAFLSKIDWLREELVRAIKAIDPYTTEADIHYFEWQNDGQPSEMQEWQDYDRDC
jgi:two-component SAPR family response regulator